MTIISIQQRLIFRNLKLQPGITHCYFLGLPNQTPHRNGSIALTNRQGHSHRMLELFNSEDASVGTWLADGAEGEKEGPVLTRVEIKRLLQQVPDDPQADAGGLEDQVEETDQV